VNYQLEYAYFKKIGQPRLQEAENTSVYGSSRPGPRPGWPHHSPYTPSPISIIPTRRSPLPITGFMGTPYTQRMSSRDPRNKNRDAAWRVFSAFFRSKRCLSVILGLLPLAFTADHTSPEALVHENPPALNMMCQGCP